LPFLKCNTTALFIVIYSTVTAFDYVMGYN